MSMTSGRCQILLFIVISYGYLWLLFGIGTLFDIQFSYDIREPGGGLFLLGIPASLFAAGIVTLVTEGKGALGILFRGSLEWRFSLKWYLAALLTPFLVSLASGAAAIWLGTAGTGRNWFSPSMPPGFMAFLLVYIGLGEEIGWRGFALPRFQDCLGPLGGSVATGVFWALWHLPLFLMPGSSQYGDSVIGFVYLLTCWTLTMAVFVGQSRGSVLPAILFHISVNFLAFAIRFPYRYFFLFWGVSAVMAAVCLARQRKG